jgi:hypothetical protein
MEMEEGQSLKRLHMDDIYASGGQKRRAASPNDEYMLSMPLNRSRGRELSPRRSPQSGFISLPRVTTMSSVHTSRSNSCISTMSMSMHPAGLATANSFGRRSPVDPSLGDVSPTSCNSPCTAPVSLKPNPRTSISDGELIHPGTISGASTRKITKVQILSAIKVQGCFMCGCCPKKPKRFDTIEELK